MAPACLLWVARGLKQPQKSYGYVPDTVRKLTMTEPDPYYRLHVFCCTNERPDKHPRGSCARAGSVKLRNYMKARAKELGLKGVRINSAGCLDRCELGPAVVIYPEGVWYKMETFDDVDEILSQHVQQGQRVSRLLLPTDA